MAGVVAVETSAGARDSLEIVLERNKEMEEENVQLKNQNQELQAKVAELEETTELLKPFIELAKDPPKSMTVFIDDERVVQGLLAWGIKYFGNALGDPDHSDDQAMRKRARRNISDFVIACCKFGLQRRDDVHAQFLTHT